MDKTKEEIRNKRQWLVQRFLLVACLLLGALGSFGFASRLWTSVLHFDPGFTFAHTQVPTGPPLSQGVTILLIDGLRLDASRKMPALNALRVKGASIEAVVGTPSFSRPGRATIVVGAPPDIHGVTSNRQKRAIPLDNLIRRVGASGGTCRIAGSKIWSGLFAEDIARCGSYQEGEAKEGPGMFVQQVPAIRDAQTAGIAFVLEKGATLRIADVISTDFAAHEYGGASAEYAAELARADTLIAAVVARMDLSRETLVVTADHGHRDAGGHGGQEPEVLAIPIVMVGAGIRPAVNLSGRQEDIAPTLAALLGLGLPAASAGRVFEDALLADDAKLAMVKGAGAMQTEALEKAVATRLGTDGASAEAGFWGAVSTHRDRVRSGRTLPGLLLGACLLIVAFGAAWFARPDSHGMFAGAFVLAITLVGVIRSLIPPMSFSGINYDEMLIPFFMKVMALAAAATLVAMVTALLAGWNHRKGMTEGSAIADAGAMAVLVLGALGASLVKVWWSEPLLSGVVLPGPDDMVLAFSLTLSTLSVSLVALLFLAAVSAIHRMGNRSTAQPKT